MKKYFLFDCETGGINKETSLLSLYGMILNKNLDVQDCVNLFVKPNNGIYHVEAGAMKVNKIDLIEHDKVARPAAAAAAVFEDFICRNSLGEDKIIPAGHNLSLDIDFCKKNFLREADTNRSQWLNFFSYRSLDTATLAQGLILAGKLPERLSCSLKSLAEYFEIDYSGAHNAEFDAKLTLEILKTLIGLIKLDNK